MSLLTFNPPPGQYSSDQTITVSGPAGVGIIHTSDNTEPVLVKTVVASNNYNPPLPYIQTIEDGRGKAIFDGSFPKFYNNLWSGQPDRSSFSALAPDFKFIHNALAFILNGGNKLLVLG